MGNKLRRYLYYYPTLMKMCAFDWMTPWPDDAVQSIAEKFIAAMSLRSSGREPAAAADEKDKIDSIEIRLNEHERRLVNIIVHFNQSIKAASAQ